MSKLMRKSSFSRQFHITSQRRASPDSNCLCCTNRLLSLGGPRKKSPSFNKARHDYLTRLFEKKKLKEKSLSKKLQTPFDRKLNRTCWPVELGKVSKIKKKPREKRKTKPDHRSLKRRKFQNPTYASNSRHFGLIFCSDSESEDESFKNTLENAPENHFVCDLISPSAIMEILQSPENLKSPETLDMIISQLEHQEPSCMILKTSSENLVKKIPRSWR